MILAIAKLASSYITAWLKLKLTFFLYATAKREYYSVIIGRTHGVQDQYLVCVVAVVCCC